MAYLSHPWATKSYSGRTRVSSLERTVNLFPEQNSAITATVQDATSSVLIGAPGNRPFLDLPDNTDVVHFHKANERLFVWTRKGVYEINPSRGAVKTIHTGNIGKSVSSAHGTNFALNGDSQLFLWWTDGIAGYIANLYTSSVDRLNLDSSYLPATTTAYLDGYAIFTRRDTEQFFWSEINDYSTFDGLDFASAEGFPDNITKIVSFERELWIVGSETTEIWNNTGDQDAPFQRIGNAFIEIGSPFQDTIQKLTRDLYMVGHDMRVYRSAAKSYRLERISAHQGVENDLYEFGAEGASAFVWTMEGHNFYCLQLPSANRTWCYDEETNQWHERSTLIDTLPQDCHLGCGQKTYGQWFINSAITHNGVTYTGGKGHVYILDLNYGRDGEERIMRESGVGPLDMGSDSVSFDSIELDFQNSCDSVIQDCEYPGPEGITLMWTDDQAKTWCSGETLNLFSNDPNYRPIWNAIGSARSRSLKWRTFTDKPVVFRRGNMELTGQGRGR